MFSYYKADDGREQPIEYLPASAIAVKAGELLVMTSGKLAKCGATAAPTYLCMHTSEGTLAAGDIIPVCRITKDLIYKTSNSASFASIAVGAKVTISADAMQVTATTSDGVAEVVGFDGTAVGSDVYVRF